MKYDPNKHHRRSIRLKGYDYSQVGVYFITICTHQRQCLFGAIANSKMELNPYGQIAAECWDGIPQHFSRIQLDACVVMPNHLHGILVITDAGRDMALPCPYERQFGKPISGSLSTAIGSFKSVVTKRINLVRGAPGTPVWQPNFYEHIIRSEPSLQRIREYIHTNPQSWEVDQLHPNNPSKW
ncbi:transposase [Funiculus sociatus GB2-A5]|uniref:Transposase n=1 Tax=Funiculus sociatus GB2-A5 TaxID=2933946 RepID=A0ABV0JTA6_9CYAN|nr:MULTISPECIES: transposase [unclassified Trichocoleus]MBD1905464.1 transposase [Trichocoleus sp. FACHB-832]MBD2062321.1 transposase [Trichocoleus sp. FACHB-6]